MPDVGSILGGAAFLGGSAALVYAGAVAGVVREALRPERKTLGWALGRGLPSEPNAWGLPAREWTHEFDGARCPVFELGDPDPAAPTAVVLHGFARSRYDALARLGPLLPHARRFLLPDLPGHGDATGRTTRLGTDEERFVASLVDGVSAPILLVGHSLGATIALHAATGRCLGPRVRGVVALAPYERLRTPLGARLDLRAMPRPALVLPALAALERLGVRERSTRESAASTSARVAIVAGGVDPVTPLAEARAIAAAAPQGRLFVVGGARHDDFETLGRDVVAEATAWAVGSAS